MLVCTVGGFPLHFLFGCKEVNYGVQEVDVDFVRKSVSSIGQVAIRLQAAAQKCVEALLELVKLKVSYVVQEAVVVIKVPPTLPLILVII